MSAWQGVVLHGTMYGRVDPQLRACALEDAVPGEPLDLTLGFSVHTYHHSGLSMT